jgi:hypothetical protein
VNIFRIFGQIALNDQGFRSGLQGAERAAKETSDNLEGQMGGAMDRIAQKAAGLGQSIQRLGVGLTAGVTTPLIAAGTAALNASLRLGNAADRLLDMSEMTGLSTDSLQAFRNVAIEAGVETTVLETAARGLTARLRATGDESKTFIESLDAIGVSAKGADGELRSMDELLPEIVGRLGEMENTTERNAVSMQIFGRSAGELAPVIALGADEIARLTSEAHDLGMVMDRETLEAANRLRIGYDRMIGRVEVAWRQIQEALVPVMTRLVDLVADRVVPMVTRFAERIAALVKWFDDLDPRIQGLIGTLTLVAVAAGPVLTAVGTMLRLLPTLIAGLGALKGALAVLVGPAGLLALLATALGVTLYRAWVKHNTAVERGIEQVDAARTAIGESTTAEGLRGTLHGLSGQLQGPAKSAFETATDALMDVVEAGDEASAALGRQRLQATLRDLAAQLTGPSKDAFIELAEQALLSAGDIEKAGQIAARAFAELKNAGEIARLESRRSLVATRLEAAQEMLALTSMNRADLEAELERLRAVGNAMTDANQEVSIEFIRTMQVLEAELARADPFAGTARSVEALRAEIGSMSGELSDLDDQLAGLRGLTVDLDIDVTVRAPSRAATQTSGAAAGAAVAGTVQRSVLDVYEEMLDDLDASYRRALLSAPVVGWDEATSTWLRERRAVLQRALDEIATNFFGTAEDWMVEEIQGLLTAALEALDRHEAEIATAGTAVAEAVAESVGLLAATMSERMRWQGEVGIVRMEQAAIAATKLVADTLVAFTDRQIGRWADEIGSADIEDAAIQETRTLMTRATRELQRRYAVAQRARWEADAGEFHRRMTEDPRSPALDVPLPEYHATVAEALDVAIQPLLTLDRIAIERNRILTESAARKLREIEQAAWRQAMSWSDYLDSLRRIVSVSITPTLDVTPAVPIPVPGVSADQDRARAAVAEQERIALMEQELEARRAFVADLTSMSADKSPLQNLGASILDLASQKVPAFGAALQGFVTAGPVGALIGVFTDLLGRSEGFANLMDAINRVLEPVGEMLGQLAQALVPLVETIGAILMPVFKVLGQALGWLGNAVRFVANVFIDIYNFLLGWLLGRVQRIEGPTQEPEAPLGRIAELEAERARLQDQLRQATTESEMASINRRIAAIDEELARLRGLGLPGPGGGAAPTPRQPVVREQTFGGTAQSVQLAVAVPLVEASMRFLAATENMERIFGGMETVRPDWSALPPFTSAIERLTPVLERLIEQGVEVRVAQRRYEQASGLQTAALRGV